MESAFITFDLRFAIGRRIRQIFVGGQWDDNPALAASAFDLYSGGHQTSQKIAAFATERLSGCVLRGFLLHDRILAVMAAMLMASMIRPPETRC